MKGKIVSVGATILIAFIILLVSMLRISSPKYAYSPMVLSDKVTTEKYVPIDYLMTYPGKILPDNPIWYLKVLRDKVWLAITFDPAKKAEINLLMADKRLMSSVELFKKSKPDLGLSTLTKSGKYLEKAEESIKDEDSLHNKVALSALKHREIIENEILPLTPEDLRAGVIKAEDYSKLTYIKSKNHLQSIGLNAPENPFEMK